MSTREKYITLLESISFAARAHQGQMRKDNQTPYVAHVLRVCMIVRHVFGCDDPQAMMAAILHDTIEDTNTDYDDLEKLLGEQAKPIADWVGTLSKDTRASEAVREASYTEALKNAPFPVKLCKLADIFDNLTDSKHLSVRQRKRTISRSEDYLAVLLDPRLSDEASEEKQIHERAVTLVKELLQQMRDELDD